MRYLPLDHELMIAKVKEIVEIEKGYRDSSITVGQIAKELGVSRSSLSTIITKEMGISFVEYVNKLRLKRARYLIKNNRKGYSLEHISLLSGYSCPSTFYRQHKKVYGTTPQNMK